MVYCKWKAPPTNIQKKSTNLHKLPFSPQLVLCISVPCKQNIKLWKTVAHKMLLRCDFTLRWPNPSPNPSASNTEALSWPSCRTRHSLAQVWNNGNKKTVIQNPQGATGEVLKSRMWLWSRRMLAPVLGEHHKHVLQKAYTVKSPPLRHGVN